MAAIAWLDEHGVLNVRSSTQVPFLTRRALCGLFDLAPDKVRVFCERVGGGFGGKQEMLVEDIVALAALKTGRPVKLELTREEQFIATIDAASDAGPRQGRRATRTARSPRCSCDVLSNTGAYGNHAGAGAVPCAAASRIGVYHCPNKRVDGVRRLHQHGAGRRVSRLRLAADR